MDKFYDLIDALNEAPADAEAAAQAKTQHSSRLSTLREQRVQVEARGLRDGFSYAAIEGALLEIDADIATVEAELSAADGWLDSAVKRAEQRDIVWSWHQMHAMVDLPEPETVKRIYEALDLKVTLLGGTHAEVNYNLPLDTALEIIVSETTSTRTARHSP